MGGGWSSDSLTIPHITNNFSILKTIVVWKKLKKSPLKEAFFSYVIVRYYSIILLNKHYYEVFMLKKHVFTTTTGCSWSRKMLNIWRWWWNICTNGRWWGPWCSCWYWRCYWWSCWILKKPVVVVVACVAVVVVVAVSWCLFRVWRTQACTVFKKKMFLVMYKKTWKDSFLFTVVSTEN